MRLKADGSLDYRPAPRRPVILRPWTAEDVERVREEVIEDLMRAHPTLTREEAEKALDGFL
jgi:hypothetical protein